MNSEKVIAFFSMKRLKWPEIGWRCGKKRGLIFDIF